MKRYDKFRLGDVLAEIRNCSFESGATTVVTMRDVERIVNIFSDRKTEQDKLACDDEMELLDTIYNKHLDKLSEMKRKQARAQQYLTGDCEQIEEAYLDDIKVVFDLYEKNNS